MKAKPHYHNAIGTVGYLLEEYEAKAKRQDDIILELFKICDSPLSPSQVYLDFYEEFPITSIRRGISNLTRDGFLEKLPWNRIKGLYGRHECTWKLVEDSNCG